MYDVDIPPSPFLSSVGSHVKQSLHDTIELQPYLNKGMFRRQCEFYPREEGYIDTRRKYAYSVHIQV